MTIPPGVKNLKLNAYVSLSTKKTKTSFTIMLVYANDVILARDSLQEMKQIKEKLYKEFKMKDLVQLKYILGIKVSHFKLGFSLCNIKHYLDLLRDS